MNTKNRTKDMKTPKITETKDSAKSYTKVDKNIYKTGKSYRVRVGKESKYCNTVTEARNWRKIFTGGYMWQGNKVVKAFAA